MTTQQNNYLKGLISFTILILSISALFYPIVATIIGYLILLTIIGFSGYVLFLFIVVIVFNHK